MTYFMDLELETADVAFRPRFETEILVEKAVEFIFGRDSAANPRILDIGTGCGNIAISLTKHIPSSRIVALDISDTALRIAGKNAEKYGVGEKIDFVKSNLFDRIEGRYGKFFDMIISNPPYVSLADFYLLPPEVKNDPYSALYGGKDGLDFYRRIIRSAPTYLKRDGILLMEAGYDQASRVTAMLDDAGSFRDVEIYKDYSGIDRIIKAENNG